MDIKELVPWHREKQEKREKRQESSGQTGTSLDTMRRDMNEMFNDLFQGFGLAPFESSFGGDVELFSPRVDVVETPDALKVSAELPGMDKEDIDVSLSRDTLTISGEKRSEWEEEGEDYYHLERSYGSFRRSVAVPCEIDDDAIEATFENGVLNIVLPKTEKGKSCRRISVKTE